MADRWGELARVHPDERRTKEALLADLGQGLKVHRDATGISGLLADRPQVAERQGQLRNSLRLDAENKVRRVVLVARAAALEMAWELQPERRDGTRRELLEAQLAQREHLVSRRQALVWLQQLDEPLLERDRRVRLAAAAQSSASRRRFRLVRELELQPCRLSPVQLRQAKLRVPMRQPEARQVLQLGATSQPSP